MLQISTSHPSYIDPLSSGLDRASERMNFPRITSTKSPLEQFHNGFFLWLTEGRLQMLFLAVFQLVMKFFYSKKTHGSTCCKPKITDAK